MSNQLDGDMVISELRDYMAEHQLIPGDPITPVISAERAARIYEAVVARYNADQLLGHPGSQRFPFRSAGKLARRPHWVLAASLAGVLAIGLGVLFRANSPQPDGQPVDGYLLAGLPPLRFHDIDLRSWKTVPTAESALMSATRIAAASGFQGEGSVQFISKIDHLFEIEFDDDGAMRQSVGLALLDCWVEPDGAQHCDQTFGPMVEMQEVESLAFAAPIIGETNSSFIPAPNQGRLTHSGELPSTPWMIADLSHDPVHLRSELTSWAGCGTSDHCLLFAITALYRMYLIPDDLAAVIWEMAATSPIVHDLGETTDRLGRPVLALAYPAFPDTPSNESLYLLLVSAETGRLIGWEEIAINDPVHNVVEPTVIGFTIWLDARFVENVGDR